MDAILLAGGIPAPDSALYSYTQGKPKAALEIGNKTMIQWVLDALEKADTIDSIAIVGCQDLQETLVCSKIINYQDASEDIISNFQKGANAVLKHNPAAQSVAVVSSDIPMLSPESINWVINASLESNRDIAYCVIDQKVMEGCYPDSGRSYTKLKDINVCGGDFSVIKVDLYTSKKDFWRKIFQARKNSFRQASLIGLDILLLLVLRRISLEDTVNKVTRRLNITGKALLCPYPEIGMDIDKPHQLELARRELTK